jgi:hypothetical protein
MTDPGLPHRFFEQGLAEYLYGPLTPSPKTVLRVPPRMKREPATGKDQVERVLVGPDQALTAISSRFEQLFRGLLGPHAVKIHQQDAAVEKSAWILDAQGLHVWSR